MRPSVFLIHSNRINHELYSEPTFPAPQLYLLRHTLRFISNPWTWWLHVGQQHTAQWLIKLCWAIIRIVQRVMKDSIKPKVGVDSLFRYILPLRDEPLLIIVGGGFGHRLFAYFFFPRQRGTCFYFLRQQGTCFFFPLKISTSPPTMINGLPLIVLNFLFFLDNEVLAFFSSTMGHLLFYPRLGYFLFLFWSAPLPFFSWFCPTPPPMMINHQKCFI